MAQQGPLSRYLGRRDINETANMQGIGLLQRIQSVAEQQDLKRQELGQNEQFRRDQLQSRKEELEASRTLARETRDLRLAETARLADQNFQIKEGQLRLEKQLGEARIAQIADANAQKKARDAFEMDFKNRELELKREIQDFKQTQAQQGAGLSGESAGKIAMADRAVLDIQEARELIFDNSGKLKRDVVAAMNVPFTAGLPLHSGARGAYARLHNAVAAKLRIETGAAATESEVRGILDRFLPKVGDPDNVVVDRLNSLEQFMNTTIDQTKGVRLDALESRKKKKPTTTIPTFANEAEAAAANLAPGTRVIINGIQGTWQ